MSRGRRALAWAALALVGAAMLAWTWGTWPNAVVDFGRELYVAWRLAEGDVLYRDIAWFNGPLSAYRNALLFWTFGPGLAVLVAANVLDVVAIVLLSWALLRRVADATAAFVGAGVFLVAFAFCQIDAVGNDNYLTPYSHEATHGVLWSLAALWASSALRERPRRAAAASGALLGLVALTKAEPLVAAAAGLACGLLLDARARRTGVAEAGARLAILLGAASVPVLAAALLLGLALPWQDAWRGALGAWPAVLASEVTSQYFYRATLGLVDLDGNLIRLLRWGAGWVLAAGATALVALRVRPESEALTPARAAAYAGAAGVSGLFLLSFGVSREIAWPEILRPLPLVAGLLAAGAVLQALRTRDERAVTAAALLVFATCLLAKVLLRTRLDQYGFALALPGTLAVVAAGVAWLPSWVGHRGGDARLARAVFLGLLSAVGIGLLPTIAAHVAVRDTPVGSGRDAFRSDAFTAGILDQTLAFLATRGPEETLAVVPEGVMIDYLSRRVNPTGHVNLMPPELLIFGEDRILAAFRAHPPDLVALAHKDTREYGVGFFGRGYGRALYRFVREGYQPVASFGDRPLVPGSRFGVTLLERRQGPDGSVTRQTRRRSPSATSTSATSSAAGPREFTKSSFSNASRRQ